MHEHHFEIVPLLWFAGWLIAVAEALDYIHGQGFVHRDVKPGNILFDSQGHAFLSDFGVAKVLASSTAAVPTQTAVTGAGMVLGTPEYMAPELIMGEPFDGRVDQYALAITVYEMLCGRRPFEDETKTKILVLHTSKTPPALTYWLPTLPDRLSQAVLKGLAKEMAPFGVRVNGVSPGVIDTPFHEQFSSPEMMKNYTQMIPLGRVGTPPEVGQVICFLASDAASFLVGETIEINGGMIMD